jgi:hypothetical protein
VNADRIPVRHKPEFIITQHPESGWDTVLIGETEEIALSWRPGLWDAFIDLSPIAARREDCRDGFTVSIIRRDGRDR